MQLFVSETAPKHFYTTIHRNNSILMEGVQVYYSLKYKDKITVDRFCSNVEIQQQQHCYNKKATPNLKQE